MTEKETRQIIRDFMDKIGVPHNETTEARNFLIEKAIGFSMKENFAEFERYICEIYPSTPNNHQLRGA